MEDRRAFYGYKLYLEGKLSLDEAHERAEEIIDDLIADKKRGQYRCYKRNYRSALKYDYQYQ
jgi:hypothetical protein